MHWFPLTWFWKLFSAVMFSSIYHGHPYEIAPRSACNLWIAPSFRPAKLNHLRCAELCVPRIANTKIEASREVDYTFRHVEKRAYSHITCNSITLYGNNSQSWWRIVIALEIFLELGSKSWHTVCLSSRTMTVNSFKVGGSSLLRSVIFLRVPFLLLAQIKAVLHMYSPPDHVSHRETISRHCHTLLLYLRRPAGTCSAGGRAINVWHCRTAALAPLWHFLISRWLTSLMKDSHWLIYMYSTWVKRRKLYVRFRIYLLPVD